jgi:hypothetical protein
MHLLISWTASLGCDAEACECGVIVAVGVRRGYGSGTATEGY